MENQQQKANETAPSSFARAKLETRKLHGTTTSQKRRADNIVLHTDGGKQFVSKETTRIEKEAGFQKSVSRPGTPCGNLEEAIMPLARSRDFA